MLTRRLSLILPALVLASLAAPAGASAATAADDIAGAPALTGAGPHTVFYDTDGATAEAGEKQHVNDDFKMNSVWVRWTPTKTGGMKLSSCGADKDPGTWLTIYKKAPGATSVTNLQTPSTTPAGDIPEWGCSGGKQTLRATAGQTYFIAIVRSKYMNYADTGGKMTLTQVTDPPKVTFNVAPTQTGPHPTITFSAPHQSWFACKLNGSTTSCSSDGKGTGSFDKVLPTGTHKLTVKATDSFYNAGSELSWTFTVDATGPDTFIDSPAPAYGGGYPQIAFHASEAGVTYRCQYDNQVKDPCTSPWQLSTVPPVGAHKITVTAHDKWGNPDPTPAVQAFDVVQPAPPPKQPTQPPTVVQPPVVAPPPVQPPVVRPAVAQPQGPCAPRVTHGRLTKRGMRVRIVGDAKRSCVVTLTLKAGRRPVGRIVRLVEAGATVTATVRPRVRAKRARLVVSAR